MYAGQLFEGFGLYILFIEMPLIQWGITWNNKSESISNVTL